MLISEFGKDYIAFGSAVQNPFLVDLSMGLNVVVALSYTCWIKGNLSWKVDEIFPFSSDFSWIGIIYHL